MINSKQAARLRAKKRAAEAGKGKPLNPTNARRLEEYEASKADPGRPKKEDQQPDPGDGTGGGADNPPQDGSIPSDSAPPADADLPPPPAPEAPPRVPKDDRHDQATAPRETPRARGGGDWRDKHRTGVAATDDGREMICEFVGGSWNDAVVALAGDLKAAGIKPWPVDPAQMRGIFILATDEILPPNFRMTPRVMAAIETTTIVGQRAYHNKKILEALKSSPEHQEWLAKQAELEKKEQADRAAATAAAEAQAANGGKPIAPTMPDPAPPDAPLEAPPPPPFNGAAGASSKAKSKAPMASDPDREPLF